MIPLIASLGALCPFICAAIEAEGDGPSVSEVISRNGLASMVTLEAQCATAFDLIGEPRRLDEVVRLFRAIRSSPDLSLEALQQNQRIAKNILATISTKRGLLSYQLLAKQTDVVALLVNQRELPFPVAITAEQWQVIRTRDSLMISAFYSRLQQVLIDNYQPKLVVANISPPIPPQGGSFAGLDPNAIQDPVVREAYLAAIEQNRQNALENDLQRVVRESLQRINGFIDSHLTWAYGKGPADFSELSMVLTAMHVDSIRRSAIIDGVSRLAGNASPSGFVPAGSFTLP